ncbi:hypothetical protein ACFX1X_038666 [Malus domestica]
MSPGWGRAYIICESRKAVEEYDGKKLVSATKEGIKLEDESEEEKQKKEKKHLDDPNNFAGRIHSMLKLSLDIDEDDAARRKRIRLRRVGCRKSTELH